MSTKLVAAHVARSAHASIDQAADGAQRQSYDLTEARADLRNAMQSRDHDDGSFAPLLIRFAWHLSGTYDKDKKTGGSNGSTMRFTTEATDPENAGLSKAIEVLAPVHKKHPYLSLADLWILAGYVAIESTGGPHIRFATGRKDFSLEEAQQIHGPTGCPFGDGKHNPCGSRLPTADVGPDPAAKPGAPPHVAEAPTIAAMRGTFTRLGFSDKETVCLIVLGHQYGRCHEDVSGYRGPWYLFDPAHWNVYAHGLGYLSLYRMAVDGGRFSETTTAAGKRQFSMHMMGGEWMMLITDMALSWDKAYRKHVEFYDSHRLDFRSDAVAAFKRLTELGCDGLLTEETTPNPEAEGSRAPGPWSR